MSARERPILFSGPMVRALLAGRKTQTRRAMPAPEGREPRARLRAPYGQPGDRLWVKETWRVAREFDTLPPSSLPQGVVVDYLADGFEPVDAGRIRVSLHMPRRLSRLVLRVRGVRVERLQAISVADAWAEGLPDDVLAATGGRPVEAYRLLWERINGAGSWARDPWVRVVEFEVEPPDAIPARVPRA